MKNKQLLTWDGKNMGRSQSPLWKSIADNRDILLTRWSRSDINPISRPGYTFGNIVWDASAAVWRYFTHYQTDNKIYQATSTDRRNFGANTLALDLGAGGAWDDTAIGVPFVWCEVGQTRPWRMFYRGLSAAGITSLGLATSTDGITWERKDTAGATLTDAVLPAAPSGFGYWDYHDIDFGSIIKVGNTYYLYYDRINTPTRKTGLATSTDLVTWTKHASNPLYIGTVGPDILGATVDDNQGRFCPDIVRWDTPNGVTRYVMFVPHYTGVHVKPEMEIYTCASPIFLQASRSFVGYMFKIDTTPGSYQNGQLIYVGNDTPRITCSDISRNVNNSTLTGHQIEMVNDITTSGYTHAEELFIYDRTLAGKVETDGTLTGCKLTNVWFDLPSSAPAFQLSPTLANVRALWLPGQTRTLIDLSGNSIGVENYSGGIDASGINFVAASTQYVTRIPVVATDALVTVLEADRQDFSLEFTCTFASQFTTGIRTIYSHSNTTLRHIYCYITGGATDYTMSLTVRSGAASKSATITFPVAGISLNTPYRFAICRDYTTGKIYFFKDGTLLNAGGSAFAWLIDDLSATNPPLPLYIGSNFTPANYWNGYIDEIRVSNSCRYTANYTPANFVINYQSSGQIFTSVYDAGRVRRGTLRLINPVLPANTSITVLARNAANLTDQSVTAGDFTLTNPTGQYHQYLITLATTSATATPSITGAIPFYR
jgi:hypothetical protein